MNSKYFFIILLLLGGAVIFGISAKQKQAVSVIPSLQPQNKTMGAVTVEVKPVAVESGENIIFEVSMNTHSVELSYDYTKIATLTDNNGNSYKPTKWTGGNSGHHLTGELVFEPLSETPKVLTLILKSIDNKSETFSWKL